MPLTGVLWILTFEQAKESNSAKSEKQYSLGIILLNPTYKPTSLNRGTLLPR
jgi:hypothetical protein